MWSRDEVGGNDNSRAGATCVDQQISLATQFEWHLVANQSHTQTFGARPIHRHASAFVPKQDELPIGIDRGCDNEPAARCRQGAVAQGIGDKLMHDQCEDRIGLGLQQNLGSDQVDLPQRGLAGREGCLKQRARAGARRCGGCAMRQCHSPDATLQCRHEG